MKLVFNTIPAPVFTRAVLARLKEGCIVIDLASLPGGVDFSAAQELGLKAVQALSPAGQNGAGNLPRRSSSKPFIPFWRRRKSDERDYAGLRHVRVLLHV